MAFPIVGSLSLPKTNTRIILPGYWFPDARELNRSGARYRDYIYG